MLYLSMECQKVSTTSSKIRIKLDLAQYKLLYFVADGTTTKPAVQPTDGAANSGQQSNALPNKADNDDISSFTDEAEEKPQLNNVGGNTNSVP